tara:strand:- start:3336 stop:4661 length:1326 start_codon:yes stop_codon:yes gene_type:complete
MANTATVGAKNLGSSGVLYDERRDFYIRPNVVKELWTDVTPFTTVIANQATMSGMADPTFKMFEHRNPWVKQQFQIDETVTHANWASTGNAGGSNVKSQDITIGTPVGIELGANLAGLELEIFSNADVAKFRCVVTEATTTTMKVVALDNVGSSAFVNTDYAMVIGSAFGEGTGAPTAWSDDLKVVWNQCQIFKTPVEITGTLLQASLRGVSKELGRLRDMKSQEHKIQKERAFLFGANPAGTGHNSGAFTTLESITDANGNALRTTMGLIPALNLHGNNTSTSYEQNIFASSDIETYSKFVDSMEKIFQYVPTSGMKRAFVGAGALGHWSKMSGASGFAGDSGWGVDIGDMKRDTLGFNYRTLETPHGMLQLIPTPSLRGPYNKHMVIVNDENLFHAQYRAPKFEASIQANDYDGVKDQYVSDEGIGITLMESHAMMVTP